MAKVVKLKQQKNAYKTHLTRSINNLKTELQNEVSDINPELLKQYLSQVEMKQERYEKSMLVLQDEDEEADITASMDEMNTMMDQVIGLKVQTEEAMKKKVKSETKEEEEKPKLPDSKAVKVKDRINLPKIQFKTFSGNIEKYQEWSQMFMTTIHNSSLPTVEKFMYLKMSLEENSEPAKLIEGYPVTEGNYPQALQELHDAYGDEEIMINHHVSKLLSLPAQSGPQTLKELYNSVSIHVRSLNALGIDSEQYSVFLVPIVKSKLSDALRKEVAREKIKDINELLEHLKKEVEIESSSHHVKVSFGEVKPEAKPAPPPKPRWSGPSYESHPPVNSAQVLATSTNSPTKHCLLCPNLQNHWVDECTKAKKMSSQQIKEVAVKANACLLCLKIGHRARNCRSRGRIKCGKCQSTDHNTYMHDERKSGPSGTFVTITDGTISSEQSKIESEKSEETVNTEESGIIETESQSVVKGALALQARLARLGKEGKIFPIVRVRMKGANNKKLELNALLDQCSDQTFVRTDVSNYLELKGTIMPMEVKGIGGITTGIENRKMIAAPLYSRDYKQEVKLCFAEMPLICPPIKRPKVPQKVLNNRKFRNLILGDDYHTDEEKEIHVLIGLDYYYHCITGRIKRGKDHPVVAETKFGWMFVSDSLNQELEQTVCATTMCTMFTSEESEKGIKDDLKKFWELDEEIISKPVNPENEAAIKKFHESVKYDKVTKQYEVGLPYEGSTEIHSNYKKTEGNLDGRKW